MFIDLNVPIPDIVTRPQNQSKKGKEKQQNLTPSASFTPGQLTGIEARIDLLVH